MIRFATEGSAACLGRGDIGRIASGMQADLSLFKLDESRFSGAAPPSPPSSSAAPIVRTGSWSQARGHVEDGAVAGLDLDALMAHHREAARSLALPA